MKAPTVRHQSLARHVSLCGKLLNHTGLTCSESWTAHSWTGEVLVRVKMEDRVCRPDVPWYALRSKTSWIPMFLVADSNSTRAACSSFGSLKSYGVLRDDRCESCKPPRIPANSLLFHALPNHDSSLDVAAECETPRYCKWSPTYACAFLEIMLHGGLPLLTPNRNTDHAFYIQAYHRSHLPLRHAGWTNKKRGPPPLGSTAMGATHDWIREQHETLCSQSGFYLYGQINVDLQWL